MDTNGYHIISFQTYFHVSPISSIISLYSSVDQSCSKHLAIRVFKDTVSFKQSLSLSDVHDLESLQLSYSVEGVSSQLGPGCAWCVLFTTRWCSFDPSITNVYSDHLWKRCSSDIWTMKLPFPLASSVNILWGSTLRPGKYSIRHKISIFFYLLYEYVVIDKSKLLTLFILTFKFQACSLGETVYSFSESFPDSSILSFLLKDKYNASNIKSRVRLLPPHLENVHKDTARCFLSNLAHISQ